MHRTSSELQLPTGLLFIVLACTRRACRALDGARALRRIVRDARPSAFPSPSPRSRCSSRSPRRPPRGRRFSRGDLTDSPAGHRGGRRDRLPDAVRGGCHQRRQRHPSPQRHVRRGRLRRVRDRTSPPALPAVSHRVTSSPRKHRPPDPPVLPHLLPSPFQDMADDNWAEYPIPWQSLFGFLVRRGRARRVPGVRSQATPWGTSPDEDYGAV